MAVLPIKDKQYYKFCYYGFLKNLRFFDPFILLFFRQMGFSFLQIGTLFAIREIATNIMEIPTGIIADAYGRRRAMIFSFCSYILSFLVFYFLPRYAFYALGMILFAVGEAFRTGTHKAMILEYLNLTNQVDAKVGYYGRTRACAQRGAALSSLIAAGLVLYSGSYRIVFLASIVPYIAGLALMISYPVALDGPAREQSSEKGIRRAVSQLTFTLKNFVDIFRHGEFLRILFNSASFDAVFKTVKDYIQPILKSLALALPVLISLTADRRTAILTGVIYFLLYLVSAFAATRSGTVEERIRSLPKAVNVTYLIGSALIVVTGGVLLASERLPAVAVFILIYVLMNVRRPLTVGYVSEQISTEVMASGLSGESQVKTILVALFAPLVGFLADYLGIGFALALMGLLLLLLYPVVRIRVARSREGRQ
jgi:MFS family permease